MGKDTQIDELRLDITVNDSDKNGSSKKVENLATAISNLSKSISILNRNINKFDGAKFTNVLENITSGLDPLISKLKGASKALASLATIVSKDGLDKAVKEVTGKVPELKTETTSDSGRKSKPVQAMQGQAEELGNISEQTKKLAKVSNDWAGKLAIAKRQLELIEGKLASGTLKESQIIAYHSKRISLLDKIDKINQQITKEKENQEKADEDGGKKEGKKATFLSKLLKSFGRIAIYRAVRRTIQEITQAFTEGIGGLARYNSEVNQSMSKITSNFAQVKASMSVALYQPLIAIEPIITSVSQGIVHLSNGLSFLFAKLRGASTYMKINTQYLKDYKSALDGTLLSFDTFETLGKGQGIDYSQMFEEVETASSSFAEELGNVKNILIEISGILLAIGGYKIVKWIADGGIKKLTDGLGGINKKIKDISTAGLIAGASFSFITSIINLIDVIKNWDSQSLVTKITAITAAVLGLAAVIFSILAAIPAIGHTIVFKALAIGTTAAGTLMGVVSAMKFADGGMMDAKSFNGAGTMYAIAGESGAEVVATGSAGTGVLNVDQFADAMVSALVRYGAARDTSNGTTIVLDGNKVGQLVASNVGFRNEANRRNAGLNWK